MNKDLENKTRSLLRQLNYFLAHVALYFISTFAMVFAIFENIDKNWWMLFITVGWSSGIIYHGLRVYGVDILNSRNKKGNIFWSWFAKLAGI